MCSSIFFCPLFFIPPMPSAELTNKLKNLQPENVQLHSSGGETECGSIKEMHKRRMKDEEEEKKKEDHTNKNKRIEKCNSKTFFL